MAQRTIVTMTCDMHEKEVEATVTRSFGLDGHTYEADLCADCDGELADAMAAFVGNARRVSGGGKVRAIGSARSGAKVTHNGQPDAKAVRAWALANGHEVPTRGRIPNSVVEAFQAAN